MVCGEVEDGCAGIVGGLGVDGVLQKAKHVHETFLNV